MGNQPAVAVVMPNFNKGKFIAESIDSVLSQTFQDFELIIVDDASTDDSLSICRDYANRDQRVRVLQDEKRRGDCAARNRGITEASAEVVTFIDSDDVYAPTKLAKQYEFFGSGGKPPVVYCDFWTMDQDGVVLRSWPHPSSSGMIFGDVLCFHFGVATGYMATKEALLRVGLFDTSLPWAGVYDMLLKLARVNEFQYIDDKLYGYRRYLGNRLNSIDREDRMRIEASIIEKHFRQSPDLLSPEQRKRASRRLMDRYLISHQFRKLLGRGLASPANLEYLVRRLVMPPPHGPS